jgi:hypothetical protein
MARPNDQQYFGIEYVPIYMTPPNPPNLPLPLGGANPQVTYVNNPNAEGVLPLDPTKTAVAYKVSGGEIYGWNVSQQTWQLA